MLTLQAESGMFLRDIRELFAEFDPEELGDQMHALIRELYPICRSITGEGVRETLRRMQQLVPLEIREVPSGTPVFDWVVPNEWNIRDAYVKSGTGKRIIDFKKSNLHVVSYSVPFRGKLRLPELMPHLHSLPDHPDWIPYRTTYYKESWGFCLAHRELLQLADEEYEVCIDATLQPGSLTYGEYVIPGSSEVEVLVSTHICHPSLCNDNLSGIVVAMQWANHLRQLANRRYTYRFLFVPGTIGAITWLAHNESHAVQRIRHGLVLSGVGDARGLSYKKSRRGNAEIDRILVHLLRHCEEDHAILDFSPYGYDERQYCSPGFNLAVGRLSRSIHGTFPQYHTSADNLNFVEPRALERALRICLMITRTVESNRTMVNTNPRCEPQLGRRGLYSAIGGQADSGAAEMAMLWVLNLSDGANTLLDIAERANMPFAAVDKAAHALEQHGLLVEKADGYTA